MSSFEERLTAVRQGIMKHAAAMKEKAKKQGFEFKPFSNIVPFSSIFVLHFVLHSFLISYIFSIL